MPPVAPQTTVASLNRYATKTPVIVRKPQSQYKHTGVKVVQNSKTRNDVNDVDDQLDSNANKSTHPTRNRKSISAMDLYQPKRTSSKMSRQSSPVRQPPIDFNTHPPRHSTPTKKAGASTLNMNTPATTNRLPRLTDKSSNLVKPSMNISPEKDSNISNSTTETYPTKYSAVSTSNSLEIMRINSDESIDCTNDSSHGTLASQREQRGSPFMTGKKKQRNRGAREVKPELTADKSTTLTHSPTEKPRSKDLGIDLKATELNVMNRAIEELLNENNMLKHKVRKKRTRKKNKSTSKISDQTYSEFNCHHSWSFKKSENDNKNSQHEYDRMRKKLFEKQQRYRILLSAESGTKKAAESNKVPYMDLIQIEKEKKLLAVEIKSLEQDLSNSLHFLDGNENNNGSSSPRTKEQSYAVKALIGEKEKLEEENISLQKQILNMKKFLNFKDCQIKSLQLQLLRHGPEYIVTKQYSGPFEDEINSIDELWMETQKDLANVQNNIMNNKKHQEKCRTERDYEKLESLLKKERKLLEVESDLKFVVADIKAEKKQILDKAFATH